jgi:hypothetical protein
MSTTAATSGGRSKERRHREPWRAHAERHGVSTRTLDRWVKAGILPPPDVINGRKYADPAVAPRRDPATAD